MIRTKINCFIMNRDVYITIINIKMPSTASSDNIRRCCGTALLIFIKSIDNKQKHEGMFGIGG